MTQCFLSYDQKGILWMMSKMMSKIKRITKGLPSKTLGSLEISMVPKAGLEPARRELRLILSQVRLPIPPLRHMMRQQKK